MNCIEVIQLLLDLWSVHDDDKSWDYAWDELSGAAQEEVNAALLVAKKFIKGTDGGV